MISRVNQSTVPTFINENSYITPMENNTILFCQSFNTERKNFIVVDYNAILADVQANGSCTVQKAFTNGWITEFPNNTDNKRKYKWTFPHTDIKFDKYHLHQDVLRDKTKFQIFVNGTPFTDFTFVAVGSNYSRKYQAALSNFYTTHIYFDNGYPSGEFEIIYYEDIDYTYTYNLRLFRSDGKFARNKGIPLTITDNNANHYYLDKAAINNYSDCNVIYKDFTGVTSDILVDKLFTDKIMCKQFEKGFDFGTQNTFIEVYALDDKNSNADGTSNWDSSDAKHTRPILLYNFTRNDQDILKKPFGPGKYVFRLFNGDTGIYSDYFEEYLQIKPFKVFSTDNTVSHKKYEGVVYSSRILKL